MLYNEFLFAILKLIVKQNFIEGFNFKWISIPCIICITMSVMDGMNLQSESRKTGNDI